MRTMAFPFPHHEKGEWEEALKHSFLAVERLKAVKKKKRYAPPLCVSVMVYCNLRLPLTFHHLTRTDPSCPRCP